MSFSSEASDSVNGGLDDRGDCCFGTSSITYVFGTEPVYERVGITPLSVLIRNWQDHCAFLREQFLSCEPFRSGDRAIV